MPSDKKALKIIITEKVLKELHQDSYTINKVINDWWYTKSSEGLRLTLIGDEMFRKAEIEFYDSELPKKLNLQTWHSFLINCSRKLKCPYYIGVNKADHVINKKLYIRLYDDKIAMLINLYGDVVTYLESIKVRK